MTSKGQGQREGTREAQKKLVSRKRSAKELLLRKRSAKEAGEAQKKLVVTTMVQGGVAS